MIDYAQILSKNYIGKQWTLDGNFYNGLTWLSETPKPSQAELDALWDATQDQVEQEKQAVINAKTSALDKLTALGLTQDEVKALIG